MTFFRMARVSLFVVIAALAVSVIAPKFVSADWQNCNGWSTSSANCAPGNLHVYVQALSGNQTGQVRHPSDFAVVVNGQTVSSNSFPGSQSGTTVSVGGAYNVTVQAMQDYTPTYSVGCNGSVMNGQEATCIITENQTSSYYGAPQPYQYPYVPQVLSCASNYQTVALGQTATFTVQGSSQGPYNWATPTQTYQAAGPILNVSFLNTGVQTVQVSNGTQIATCTVNVVTNGPANVYPTPATSLVTSYVPSLPNTGFMPLSRSQIILAILALIAAGFFAAPYVRKATTIALG